MDTVFFFIGISNVVSGVLFIEVYIPLLYNKIGMNRFYGFRFKKSFTMTFAAATLLIVPLSVLAADDRPVIRSGCSGGVTGGGSGYEIRRDGRISSWRTDSWNSASQSTPLRTDKAAADRIFALFDKAGFARVEYNEPGNMKCFLTLESGGKSHTVSWSGKPPQQIRELNDAVTTMVTGKPTQGGLTVMDGVPPPAPKLEPTEKYAAPTGSP